MLTSAGTSRMTVALPPRAVFTWLTSVSGLLAGALTSTAMLRTRPSWRPRAVSTIPSTPEIPTGACAPTVSRVLVAAVTGYWPPPGEPRRPVRRGGGDEVAGREVRPHLRVARGRGRRPRAQRRLGRGEHGELPAVDGDLRPVDGEHGPDAAQLAQPGQVGRGHAARHRGDDVGHDQAGGGGPGEGGARRRVAGRGGGAGALAAALAVAAARAALRPTAAGRRRARRRRRRRPRRQPPARRLRRPASLGG